MSGKFIVIEGLDGSGKGTQIERLAASLYDIGIAVHITNEPTDGYIGKYLRQMLKNSENKDMCLQGALFLADRLDHVTNPTNGIKSYLDKGITVICDRYYYSSFAYQGTAADMDWVMNMNLNAQSMLTPDLCIFFDVNPEECMDRIAKTRENPELYEKDIDITRKIRNNFHNVFARLQGENIKIIDANRDIATIAKETLDIVLEVLN
ncbi:MAG: dTMP kinase [Oscillospiraceae bacterium]|nr:dTMP kinase [Oscillospiraceae bacterium]